MGIYLPGLIISLTLFLSGCGPVGQNLAENLQRLTTSCRKPGDDLIEHPNAVWQKNDCATQTLPFIKLDGLSIRPDSSTAGSTICQRFIYSLCPAEPAQVVRGNLTNRVYFNSKVLTANTKRNFKLKPGRWKVDSLIKIPPNISPGVYYIEIEFVHKSANFKGGAYLVIRE